jgi:ATP synthase F1 complex assembly factor 1
MISKVFPRLQNTFKYIHYRSHPSVLSPQYSPIFKRFSIKTTTTLDDVLHLQEFKKLDPETMSKYWNLHFIKTNNISATLSFDLHQKIRDYASKYPRFVIPIPRGQGISLLIKESGFEFFVIEFTNIPGNMCVLITPLQWYAAKGIYAPICFGLIFYTDLASTSKLVFMKGNHGPMEQYISLAEAQNISYQIQSFYALQPEKMKLVEKFNVNPKEFDYQEIIDAVNILK